mgnify:CR=1 FL=1
MSKKIISDKNILLKMIVVLFVITIILGVSYALFNSNNKDDILPKCNLEGEYETMIGEIIEVKSVAKKEMLIKTEDKEIIVEHSYDIRFKIGQKIEITYDGTLKESNPLKITALCIEII